MTDEVCNHDHSPSQKPGMSNKEFLDRLIVRMDELADFGILEKGDYKDENGEYGYGPTLEFKQLVEKHYEIQAQIEYMDSKKGIDSTKEYGEHSRDRYIVGIAINDHLNFTPKDCEKCKEIAIKYRLDDGYGEVMDKHVEKDHPESFKKIEDAKDKITEWVFLVNDILNRTKEKVWRSTQ